MTRLLVSVRDAEEARDAVAGGADLVDVKEPARGALGRADVAVWRSVAFAVGDAVPCSAALGELREYDASDIGNAVSTAMKSGGLSGFRFAKLGLAGCAQQRDWATRLHAAWQALPTGIEPVAVVYADHARAASPPPAEVIAASIAGRSQAVLIDTFAKDAGHLFSHLSGDMLRRLIALCRDRGLLVVLAGSLDASALPQAIALAPDYIAVRGAVCRPNRAGRLDAALVRRLRETIARSHCADRSHDALAAVLPGDDIFAPFA
jgi:uncharacterized protein (UPF0264 family)